MQEEIITKRFSLNKDTTLQAATAAVMSTDLSALETKGQPDSASASRGLHKTIAECDWLRFSTVFSIMMQHIIRPRHLNIAARNFSLVVMLAGVAACKDNTAEKLYGTWTGCWIREIEFRPDGTGKVFFSGAGQTYFDTEYSVSGNNLTLIMQDFRTSSELGKVQGKVETTEVNLFLSGFPEKEIFGQSYKLNCTLNRK